MKALDGGKWPVSRSGCFIPLIPTKYEAGYVSETVWTHKTEKKMVPTPGIETLSLGEQNVTRIINLSVAMSIY